jgi:hypothetical protein
MTDKKNPEPKPNKPRTRLYLDDYPKILDWCLNYRSIVKTETGVELTDQQCFAAFAKQATDSLGKE